jgi:hypothetical protein
MVGSSTKEVCKSSRSGDSSYKLCSSFCNTQHAQQHCSWCKCQTCSFCKSTTLAPTALVKPHDTIKTKGAKSAGNSTHFKAVGTTPHDTTKTSTNAKSSNSNSTKIKAMSTSSATSLSDVQELARVRGALRAAEARLQVVEKQLGLCQESSAKLRLAAGLSAPPPPPPRQRGAGRGGGMDNGTSIGGVSAAATDAVINPACADAVSWAQHIGIVRYTALYPGLNASSPARDFQMHLHLNDPASGCPDPRSAAEQLLAGDSSASTLLLFVGVLFCALCNAYSLGYLTPNRHVRAMLQPLGLATPLVR